MKKIFTTLLFLTLLALPATLPLALPVGLAASDTSDVEVDGNISLIRCIKRGGLDFGIFWDAVIYNDNLKEGVIEPWNDILFRNQCQANDIIGLVRQQDNVRSSIRNAFLTCDTEELPALKERFHDLTAEIYYVRHIVDGGLALSLPYDVLTTHQMAASVVKSRTEIYNDMYKQYVDTNVLTPEQLDRLFLEFERRYADRVGSAEQPGPYMVCDRGSWQEVAEKWEEFQQHFTEDFGGLKSAADTIAARAESIEKDLKNFKIVEFLTTDMSVADYMSTFVQMNVNGLPPSEGFGEISERFFESLPTFEAPTQKELLGGLSSAAQIQEVAKLKTTMDANFYGLYRDASDSSLELFLQELDELIQIIRESFPWTTQIKECAETMNDRQCPL